MALAIGLGICLIGAAVILNISWIILNWREFWMLIAGAIIFILIIFGIILNTLFLVREIRRNEQHDSFINAVTHELKTPITSIRLYLQTLQTREVDTEQRHHFYSTMLDDTERLMRTVEHVLKAGQVAHKKQQERFRAVDIKALIAECMDLVRAQNHLGEECMYWGTQPLKDEPCVVMGEVEELRTALTNVLDNAVKYSRERVDTRIDLTLPSTDRLKIDITDKGIGISRGELDRIFRRFYRVSPRPAVRGSGLGLFIVRSIARRHGGKAYAHSEGAGKGATVTLELPRAQDL